jgi:hypothetical protein
MIPVLLCLAILLVLTGTRLAHTLRYPAASHSCRSGQWLMPDLNGLIRRSSARVVATGRLIKGLSHSENSDGPNAVAAFYMACDRHLEQKPILMTDFRSSLFFLDCNRDGCVEATERYCQVGKSPGSMAGFRA